jgi:hypothetical protein
MQDTLRFENNESHRQLRVRREHDPRPRELEQVAGNPDNILGTWFMAHANLDTVVRVPSVVGLGASISLNSPDAVPQAGSVLIGSADWTDSYLADRTSSRSATAARSTRPCR